MEVTRCHGHPAADDGTVLIAGIGLKRKPLDSRHAHDAIKIRAKAAGLPANITNHTFRAVGITTYLQNDGQLETAQHLAGHASPKTTKLYDRRSDHVEVEEIHRVRL